MPKDLFRHFNGVTDQQRPVGTSPVEPIDAIERDGKTVVIGKVSGNFPNSPVKLEHIFGLEGEKIVSLEIR